MAQAADAALNRVRRFRHAPARGCHFINQKLSALFPERVGMSAQIQHFVEGTGYSPKLCGGEASQGAFDQSLVVDGAQLV